MVSMAMAAVIVEPEVGKDTQSEIEGQALGERSWVDCSLAHVCRSKQVILASQQVDESVLGVGTEIEDDWQ